MQICKKCGIEITENNRVLRERGKWRKECRECLSKRKLIWAKNNKDKRKITQNRYNRKKGKGIDYPCLYCGKMAKRRTGYHYCSDECRFMAKVKKKDCWEWESQLTSGGYGKFNLKGKTILAHRYSYMIFKGEIPEEMQVCHSCDNRKCVNPSCLWLGTAKENMQDAKNKKRLYDQSGFNASTAKLTRKMIEEILKLDKKMPRYKIAKKFNVSPMIISNLLNKKTYKGVYDELFAEHAAGN